MIKPQPNYDQPWCLGAIQCIKENVTKVCLWKNGKQETKKIEKAIIVFR